MTCEDKDNMYSDDPTIDDGSPIQIVWSELSGIIQTKLGLQRRQFDKTEWGRLFKIVIGNASGINYKQRHATTGVNRLIR
jgi:hypothetical protein